MKKSIESFPAQFSFVPRIEEEMHLPRMSRAIVAGMGGSNLAAPLLSITRPNLDLIAHRDYGLPPLPEEDLRDRLIICTSYSGNTEETIDAFHTAQHRHFHTAVITTGGTLLELAKKAHVPHIILPNPPGLQPRLSTGFQMMSIMALLRDREGMKEASGLVHTLRASDTELPARSLAGLLHHKIPLVYASRRNFGIAYNWKVKFNETTKNPAFANMFPEVNHNEMTGFDMVAATRPLSKQITVIMLRDENDHPRILARMTATEALYHKRGIDVHTVPLKGVSVWHRITNALLLADWTAYSLALFYGAEPNEVPMVEEFKKRIA